MTIKIEVECDAFGCINFCEIEDNHSGAVTREGWHEDPNDGFQHYCPRCWPQVKKQIEEEEDRDDD